MAKMVWLAIPPAPSSDVSIPLDDIFVLPGEGGGRRGEQIIPTRGYTRINRKGVEGGRGEGGVWGSYVELKIACKQKNSYADMFHQPCNTKFNNLSQSIQSRSSYIECTQRTLT